jgi:hypothetical protein
MREREQRQERDRRSKRIKRLKRINMAQVTSIAVTFDDGTVQTVGGTPVVAPTDTEVDVLLSDGTTKKFVPQG